jgi:hypothetical protein
VARVRIKGRSDLGDILKGVAMHQIIDAKTREVAANVEAMGIKVGDRDGGPHEYDLPVDAKVVTTDRAHGIVAITHPAGQAVQAKHGALTKAVAQAGLDFKAE